MKRVVFVSDDGKETVVQPANHRVETLTHLEDEAQVINWIDDRQHDMEMKGFHLLRANIEYHTMKGYHIVAVYVEN